LVPNAGPFGDAHGIPEELADFCSKVRVPALVVATVAGANRTNLSSIEDETRCLTFWLPQGTQSSSDGGVLVAGGAMCAIGDRVEAQWAGEWSAATLLGQGSDPELVRVTWDVDGSEQDIAPDGVRPAGSKTRAVASGPKKTGAWAQGTRVLAVIGNEKSRRSCIFKVMALTENCSPGIWTGSLEDAEKEARDGKPEEEVFIGVEAAKHEGTSAEMEWLRTSMAGQQAMTGAARASGAAIQIVGSAFFFAGFPAQRQRGREYVQWACKSRMQQGIARFQAGGAGGKPLSVVDADMRDDVTVMVVVQAQMEFLRPERLAAIEQETEVMLVFDDGGGSILERGSKRLLICGDQDLMRQKALRRVNYFVAGAALAATAPGASSSSEREPALRGLGGPGPGAAPVKRPFEQDAGQDAKRMRPAGPAVAKSDARVVLKSIPWPDTINQWGQLQNKVWAGHPKLQRGWIRCWSRSQDSEYYLRLSDKQTTFNIQDVLA